MEDHDRNRRNVLGAIPERIKRHIWDARADEVDLERHKAFLIRRIIEFGDLDDVRWMLDTYPRGEIIQVLKKSKGISRKSAWFWATYFDVAPEDIACLKTPYLRKQNSF